MNIFGGIVSRVIETEPLVISPLWFLASTIIVFNPYFRVTLAENLPFSSTVALTVLFIVTVFPGFV